MCEAYLVWSDSDDMSIFAMQSSNITGSSSFPNRNVLWNSSKGSQLRARKVSERMEVDPVDAI